MPPSKTKSKKLAKTDFDATAIDPYFDGKLADHVAKTVGGNVDLEVEVRILADDAIPGIPQVKNGILKPDVITIVKNALARCVETADSKTTVMRVQNTVNWMTKDYKVLQKTFDGDANPIEGSVTYQKSRINKDVGMDVIFPCGQPHSFGMKLDAQIEKPLTNEFNRANIDTVRVRSRFVFEHHPMFPGWRIDVSRTYTTSGNIRVLVQQVKHYTNLMFKGCHTVEQALMSDAWNHAIQIEVEMEWMGETMKPKMRIGAHDAFTNGPLLLQKWMSIDAAGSNNAEFQETVFDIASNVMSAGRAARFESALGLKSLGVQVVDLSRREYFTDWRFRAEEFAITDKADGDRAMIIGDSKGIRMVGAGFTQISDDAPPKSFILDGELLDDGRYLAFDCLMLGTTCIDEPLRDRLTAAQVAVSMIPGKRNQYYVKEFVFLDGSGSIGGVSAVASSKKQTAAASKEKKQSPQLPFDVIVKDFCKRKRDFDTDGVVFTPVAVSYFKMTVYKWKPPSHISVDFFIAPGEDGEDSIAVGTKLWLMSGVTQEAFAKMALRPPRRWTVDNSRDLPAYFAVPFMPSIQPTAYQYELTANDVKLLKKHFGSVGDVSLNKQIVEMGFIEGPHDDGSAFKFRVMRIREDRANEVARGGYFGNDFRIAELTCMSAANPLTIDDFRPIEDVERRVATGALSKNAATGAGYFSVVDNQDFKAVRSYNSTAKQTIFGRFMHRKPSGLDLASGQGQDLQRWASAGVRHLTMIDRDPQGIYEIINRKYTLIRGKGKIKAVEGMKMNLRVAQMDLSSRGIVRDLIQMGFSQNVEILHCGLAIHYFAGSADSVQKFIDIVDQTLAPGGWFVFSSFDGQRVLDLLRENDGVWATSDGKYRIEWVGPTAAVPKTLPKTGAKIRAKLPFSGDELYEEYLFNIDYWTEMLQKRKINRSAVLPFGESEATRAFVGKKDTATLGKPEIWNKLSHDDKIFAGLYSYYVFIR